ncbi:MAG: MFS transporter [Spirochaetota bacterium]
MTFSICGAATPATIALATDLSTPDTRQATFSLLYLGHNLGFAVGPLVAGFLFLE